MATYRVIRLAVDGKPVDSRLLEADSKADAISIAREANGPEDLSNTSYRAVLAPE